MCACKMFDEMPQRTKGVLNIGVKSSNQPQNESKQTTSIRHDLNKTKTQHKQTIIRSFKSNKSQPERKQNTTMSPNPNQMCGICLRSSWGTYHAQFVLCLSDGDFIFEVS